MPAGLGPLQHGKPELFGISGRGVFRLVSAANGTTRPLLLENEKQTAFACFLPSRGCGFLFGSQKSKVGHFPLNKNILYSAS